MRTIMEMLADGEFVSGEVISAELGVSRVAVWKKIDALRAAGWQIESGGKRGYRLIAGDNLQPELWQNRLETRCYGRGEVLWQETLDSTNTQLKHMAVSGVPDGSVCLCECQTAGRGRLGRAWNSPAGQGLWCSVLLRPKLSPAQAPLITLCTALAMARAVREVSGIDARIKWPNDLVCGGKKLCGILLECAADPDRLEWVVVGTGLNVHENAYPPELKHQATSLAELGNAPLRRELLIHYLAALENLVDRLEQDGFNGIAGDYKELSCTLGSRVQVSGVISMTGTAEAIDESGALLVRDDAGELHRVLSGDVSVRGVMGYA